MSVHPTFRYDDPRTAIAFLTETLGFVAENVHTGADGGVEHAVLSFRTSPDDTPGAVLIGPRRGPTDQFDTGRAVTYLVVTDPDARHERAVAAGADIVHGPVDQPYGSREIAVRDPEGNIWSLGTYQPVVKP